MRIKINSVAGSGVRPRVMSFRCPHCGHDGSFETAGINDAEGFFEVYGMPTQYSLGIRRCPRPECHGQLMFQRLGDEIETFPALRIDFDATGIPASIVACFQEALQNEAHGSYISSAIMVRKTLEMICDDRGATGRNLVERVQSLRSQVTLPPQLFDAMDNLRLLGNDAAHVESKEFEDIGEEELIVAIDLTKEILKGIYQLDSIVERLENLKKVKE